MVMHSCMVANPKIWPVYNPFKIRLLNSSSTQADASVQLHYCILSIGYPYGSASTSKSASMFTTASMVQLHNISSIFFATNLSQLVASHAYQWTRLFSLHNMQKPALATNHFKYPDLHFGTASQGTSGRLPVSTFSKRDWSHFFIHHINSCVWHLFYFCIIFFPWRFDQAGKAPYK